MGVVCRVGAQCVMYDVGVRACDIGVRNGCVLL